MAAILPPCTLTAGSTRWPQAAHSVMQPTRPSRLAARSYLSGAPVLHRPRSLAVERHRRRRGQITPQMGLFGLGLPELAVIAGVAALIFGPSKLPSVGKELGKTVKSFQTAAKEFETELKNAANDEDVEKTGSVPGSKKD